MQALLSEKQVMQRTSLSRTSIWRLRQSGSFPEPVKITERRVAYREDEVAAWIEARGQHVHSPGNA